MGKFLRLLPKIANKYREKQGKIPPEQMHLEMVKAFKHASESGGVVFVDMCHNKPDILKDIMSYPKNMANLFQST
jgi:hypothetical protein